MLNYLERAHEFLNIARSVQIPKTYEIDEYARIQIVLAYVCVWPEYRPLRIVTLNAKQ